MSENVEEAKKSSQKNTTNGLVVKKIEVWYNMTKCKKNALVCQKINKTVHGFANTRKGDRICISFTTRTGIRVLYNGHEHEHHHDDEHHHEHDHAACDAQNCESGCGGCQDKTAALIDYMLKHNEHHAAELDQLADQASCRGQGCCCRSDPQGGR